jgi:hypothetical protein
MALSCDDRTTRKLMNMHGLIRHAAGSGRVL